MRCSWDLVYPCDLDLIHGGGPLPVSDPCSLTPSFLPRPLGPARPLSSLLLSRDSQRAAVAQASPAVRTLIRGADGDADNVQYALCEVVGVRPRPHSVCAVGAQPQGTKGRHPPKQRYAKEMRQVEHRQASGTQGSSKINSSNQQK